MYLYIEFKVDNKYTRERKFLTIVYTVIALGITMLNAQRNHSLLLFGSKGLQIDIARPKYKDIL